MRKVSLLAVFVILTPLVMVLGLIVLSQSFNLKNTFLSGRNNPQVAFAALPPASGTLTTTIKQSDARVGAVQSFFKRYNSSLYPYAQNVVTAADKYGIDYRLIPAIAMQESNLCKKVPKGSYNCWGFGIYGKKVTKFDGYAQAIDIVSKTLATQYKAQGLNTPEEIMSRYTPSSNGSWAFAVSTFMNQLSVNL